MILSVQGVQIEIDDKYIQYSPYLSTMMKTDLAVETKDDAFVLEDDPEIVQQYVQFLQGLDFEMSNDVAEFFDFMGHENNMCYPLNYWKVKLKDNWIRDNFYKYELHLDPYYRLVKIPIVNKLNLYKRVDDNEEPNYHDPLHKKKLQMTSIMYIAGGAALWMAGAIDELNDIDVFFVCDEDAANKYMYSCEQFYHYDSVSNLWGYNKVDEDFNYQNIQFIHRLYQSPAQIVYGFDLDCVGILYDGTDLWATERTMYAIQNRVNWFDPIRASPSYTYRLSKYKSRGFDIQLPMFTDNNINREQMDRFLQKITDIFVEKVTVSEPIGDIEDREYSEKFLSVISPYLKNVNSDVLNHLYSFINNRFQNKSTLGSIIHAIDNFLEKDTIPSDSVSGLILAKYYGVICTKFKRSDYDKEERAKYVYSTCKSEDEHVNDLNRYFKKDLSLEDSKTFALEIQQQRKDKKIVWKVQDPMTQITGTFQPEPIGDIIQWYSQSPFYSPIQEE